MKVHASYVSETFKVELPIEVEMGVMSLLFLLAGAVLEWMRAPVAERFRG